MGPEDKVDTSSAPVTSQIPGLDFEGVEDRHKQFHKKVLRPKSSFVSCSVTNLNF